MPIRLTQKLLPVCLCAVVFALWNTTNVSIKGVSIVFFLGSSDLLESSSTNTLLYDKDSETRRKNISSLVMDNNIGHHASIETTGKVDDTGTDVDKSRAIVAISLGEDAAKTKIVERFVWSARYRGDFSSWIVVLTDAMPDRYSSISYFDNKVVILHPPRENFSQRHNHTEMIRKRFKTYVLEYLELDSRLDMVQLVYYLDVDLVFARPLVHAFVGLEDKYKIGGQTPRHWKESSIMWMFQGNRNWPIQGGQVILERHTSQPCLDRWRYYIDHNVAERKDQVSLKMMIEEQDRMTSLQCRIVSMEQGTFIEFPEKHDIVKIAESIRRSKNKTSGHVYSPLVHIRNTAGIDKLSKRNHRLYLQDILGSKADQLGLTQKMFMMTV